MCMLENIAVMEHDKTPSLRPGPSHSKEVAGVCGDIPEGSKVQGDLALVTEQLPQPKSRNLRQWVELSCTKRIYYVFPIFFLKLFKKPITKFHWINLPHIP